MTNPAVLEQMRRRVTPESYEEIRDLWKKHSIAEDARDIPGLMSTLTEDCVYELPQTGSRWIGHEGATQFYLSLLAAFPDVHFDLQHIIIGPQGVFEEAHATGTHKDQWLGQTPTGEPVAFRVLIHFPWDSERHKFTGERVYFFWDLIS
jgi:predicted ester cyclase